MNPVALYGIANASFAVVLAVGAALGSTQSASLIYLVLLFMISSSPILNLRRFNDRYALLALFSFVYFFYFGLFDVIRLYSDASTGGSGLLSATEVVILVGGVLAQIGYRVAARGERAQPRQPAADWPERTLVLGGCVFWCVATWFAWQLRVEVLPSAINTSGLERLSSLATTGLMLANILQPLAIAILAYAQCRYRRAYMLPLLVGVVLFQMVFGFVIDIKAETLIGVVLVILTKVLVDGRLPKSWLVATLVFVAVAFPAMQANRMLRAQYGWERADVVQHLPEVAKEAFAQSEEVRTGPVRAQTVFERLSLKGSVEMIVTRTGNDVPFQRGYTLQPLYTAFVPRLIWPSKPDIQTGRLVNTEFSVSRQALTYISPSHLGELYWNFGWPGVIAGMTAIGLLLGFIGKHADMSQAPTMTRLLVMALTFRTLIVGFEGVINVSYVTWMRAFAAIMILHLLFARRHSIDESHDSQPDKGRSAPLYPNLLR